MNAQTIQQLFEGLFTGAAGAATAPMLALGVGVLLSMLVDVFPAARPARPLVFLGSLAVAFFYEVAILRTPPGTVLDGTLLADGGTALWGMLFLIATALAFAYSVGYYRAGDASFKPEHDMLLLTAPVGMMLMVGARDLIVFFVGLELLSIPLYALAAFRRSRSASVEAGLKYFLLGAFATGFFLYGSALLYSQVGSLSLADLAAADKSSTLALAGLALITASLFFKASVFPFHLWVPDVYEGSPTPVTGLMATGTKAAAIGFLVQLGVLLPPEAAGTVAAIALLTMAAGNLGALMQEDLKRMLAYSGIAHAGTLLLVVAGYLGGGLELGPVLAAALFYMGAYVFTTSGAFGLIALLEADGEHFTKLDSLRGLARSRPGVAAAMTLFMLSLAGIPATGGFLGKWLVFSVLIDAGMITTAVLGVLLTLIAFGFYLRVLVVMYMQPEPEGQARPTTTRPLSAGLATLVCAAGVLAMGLLPSWFLNQLG